MKKKVLLLSIIGIFVIGIVISFAYWSILLKQESTNIVTSDCFDIEFLDENEISIRDAYPMSDEEGLLSLPYRFKIVNQCGSYTRYQINLETILHNNKVLPEKYLKVQLLENKELKITSKLTSELEVEPTLEDATSAYKLNMGVLRPNEEKEYHLRIWMHSDVTASDLDSMNATYQGKVSIVASYINPSMMILDELVPLVSEGSGLYEVNHEDASITYTEDVEAQNRLKQTEYRYAGSNPNNYVKFNNELWRIIGLVNTPEGQRVKITRDESIGEYSWDSSAPSINSGYGVNEWSSSKIENLLNAGAYYNRTTGTCYNGRNNATVSCDFSEVGLLLESKEMIDTITWNLGSNGNSSYTSINLSQIYNQERSNNTGKNCNGGNDCNDNTIRNTLWRGQIGLMYPSDYGYATSHVNVCLDKALYDWNNTDCYQNNWLFSSAFRYTMTPLLFQSKSYLVFYVSVIGSVRHSNSNNMGNIHPTLYLKTNNKITGGNGTTDSPYELSIDSFND